MSLSNITLSASVRQNLLSLQGTADLLSTTQTRLATGKKVNSALDNPTNFFTAAGLDARASDIGNLLDSIGNGVQVLQAANTGITSLSKLVDTAKSIANQALQQPGGYSTKASLEFTGGTTTPSGVVSASDLNEGVLAGQVFSFKTKTGTTAITLGGTPAALSGGAATVKTLDQFNQALAAAGVNLAVSITNTDKLTFTSTNDGAGQVITKSRHRSDGTRRRRHHQHDGAAIRPLAVRSSQRLRTRCRRLPVQVSLPSTTRSSSRSKPRPRTRPSTASTC